MSTPDEIGADDWESLARAAVSSGDREETELLRELLAFDLGGDSYALPVERVREIVRMRPVTPMPRVPEAVLGVIALRGEVIQVVDLRRRLGMPAVEPTRRSRIVVLHGEDGRTAGLLVDGVTQVLRLREADVSVNAPGDVDAVEALCARGDEFVSLIDLERVLEVDDV